MNVFMVSPIVRKYFQQFTSLPLLASLPSSASLTWSACELVSSTVSPAGLASSVDSAVC